MKKTILRALVPATLSLALVACGEGGQAPAENATDEHAAEEGHAEEGVVTLTQQQIAEEALTLKETGVASLDQQSTSEIKAGAIAY